MKASLSALASFALALPGTALPDLTKQPALPGPAVPDGLGVNIHFTDPRPGELEMLAAAGFRWVRMDFGWQATEKERGQYDFSAYLRLCEALDRHRLRALFILDYANPLYESERSIRTADGRAAFARWAAAAAARFRGRGILWEIWNEPNIPGFWKPEPDADHYTALAKAAAAAIRTAAPGETIVGPATSGIDLKFLESCFRLGLLDCLDAVTVHPYRQQAPETVAADYRKLRQLIARHAAPGRQVPVLSGEWGYSAAWAGHDEDRQGQMLPRQWLTNLSCGIPLSIWYDWRDDGTDPKEPEHHFGTVGHELRDGEQPAFRPKPAYLAARTLTATLGGMRFVRRLATGRAEDHLLLFEDDQRQALACWTTGPEAREIRLPLQQAPARCLSHLGDPLAAPAVVRGFAAVPLDAGPRYLVFPAKDPALVALPSFAEVDLQTLRLPGGKVRVAWRNPGDTGFRGTLRLACNGQNHEQPLTASARQQGQADFGTGVPDRQAATLAVRLLDGRRILREDPPRTVRFAAVELLGNVEFRPDGDPTAESSGSFAAAGQPGPLPGFEAPVWKLDYRFGTGWSFLNAKVRGEPPIPGTPRSFGLWVHGDAGGTMLRLRVRDANGRTWQPDGALVDWRGWRHIEFALDGHTACWGGQGPANLCPPLRWESWLVVDNVSRKPCSGQLLLSTPTVVE